MREYPSHACYDPLLCTGRPQGHRGSSAPLAKPHGPSALGREGLADRPVAALVGLARAAINSLCNAIMVRATSHTTAVSMAAFGPAGAGTERVAGAPWHQHGLGGIEKGHSMWDHAPRAWAG